MPPRKPGRAVAGEQHLAERIGAERERRGWSYEQLARAMTNAGCPMNQSAIYKIEKGEPRRRITVDELLGFAKVFGTNISALVLEQSIVDDAQSAKLFQKWQEAEERAEEARRLADAARDDFVARAGIAPDVVRAMIGAASGSTVWPADRG